MPETEVTSVRREALIVATDAYEDPKLRALRAPARDAEELARVLANPQIGDFDVGVSFNEPDHIVRRKISEFFRDRGRDDLLLLHISCHGLKDDDGTLYFASSNTSVELLEATALPSEFVNRQMTRSRSRRIVLLLDCCFGGAFARGMVHRAGESVAIKEEFDGQGRVVLTASRAMEYAFEGDQLEGDATPSVFTSAIVEGLESGLADRDRDSRISVDELYDYVYDRVREATPNQTPSKWTFDVQGELYIARSPFSGVEPDELPAELRAAMESPFAHVRAGAVEELARLVAGTNLGLATSARAALETLADDDSKRVSDRAASALAEGVPFPEPTPAARLPAAPSEPGPARVDAAPLPKPRPSATGRLAALLTYAAHRRDPLALVGAACLVLGYFRAASWESAWTFAVNLEEGIWWFWSPVEALVATVLVLGAVLAHRRGRLPRAWCDGLLLGVGAVVFVAMVAFVGSWFEFEGASKWTGFGALAIAAAGALGLLTHRAPEVELPPGSVPAAVAGVAFLVAPLVTNVGSEGTALTDWGGTYYIEVLAGGAAAVLALLGFVWRPRLRLHAGGALAAVGLLLAVHVAGIIVEYGHENGFSQIRLGGVLGIVGGLVLAVVGARIARPAMREDTTPTQIEATPG